MGRGADQMGRGSEALALPPLSRKRPPAQTDAGEADTRPLFLRLPPPPAGKIYRGEAIKLPHR